MGLERLQGAYAWRSMLDQSRAARLRLRFPGREPQPLPRPRRRDQPRGCAGPAARRLAARAAAVAWSRPSPPSPAARAFAGFAEDRLGTLEPGRMADFIFIDRDIFAARRPARRSARRRCWRPMSAGRRSGSGASRPSAVEAPGRQHLRQHLGLAARRVVEVERHARAAVAFEEAADRRIAARPVADQHRDAARAKRLGDLRAAPSRRAR